MAQVAISTKLSLATHAALDDYAERTGESKASIIEAAIQMYIAAKSK
jgi:predicted transcriptional regulator